MSEDISLIQPEYNKHWQLYNDFYELLFVDFDERVLALEGKIGQIISLRSRYLNGDKMTSEEKFVAKDVLTSKQKDYKEAKKYKSDKEGAISLLSGIGSIIKGNQERRQKNGNNDGKGSIRVPK